MASRTGGEQKYRERVRKARLAVLTILAFSLIIFIAIAALAVLNEGVDRFAATLDSINPFYFGLALLCALLSMVAGYPKWELFVKKLGVKIKRSKNLAIYLSMFSMDITPGRWGRAVVSYTLNRLTGTKFARTFPAVVADIFTDFLGFIAVTLVLSFLVQGYTMVSVVISVLLLIPFCFIYIEAPFDYIRKKLHRFKRLRWLFNVGELYFKSSRKIDTRTYAYAMLFTIPSVVLNGLALYFVMLSFGINVGIGFLPTVLFIYTSSLLIGMVTGIPGALGVTDAALLSYLTTFFAGAGVTFGIASAITIFFRIASLWFTEGFSTVFLVYTFRYWKVRKR